jgi:hypothetical protein
MCATCDKKYRENAENKCVPCSGQEFVQGLLLLLIPVILLVLLALKSLGSRLRAMYKKHSVKAAAVGDHISGKVFGMAMYLLQVLQVLTQIRKLPFLGAVAPVLQLVSFDMGALNLECGFELTVNFGSRLVLLIVAPIMYIVMGICVLLVVRKKRQDSYEQAREGFVSSTFKVASAVYVPLGNMVSNAFVCYPQKDGSKTFVQDPNIDCYSDQWYALIPYVAFGGVFLAAVPVFLLVVLLRAHKHINDQLFRSRFGWLMNPYRAECYYWSIVLVLRKLAVAFVVTLLPGEARMTAMVAVLTFFLLIQATVR